MFGNRVKPLLHRTTREFAGNAKIPTKGFDFEFPSFALGLDRHENLPCIPYMVMSLGDLLQNLHTFKNEVLKTVHRDIRRESAADSR